MYKWNWPEDKGGKLRKPLNFQLNQELGVRVVGKHNTTLSFKSDQKVVELPVGPVDPEALRDTITEFPTVRVYFTFSTSFKILHEVLCCLCACV